MGGGGELKIQFSICDEWDSSDQIDIELTWYRVLNIYMTVHTSATWGEKSNTLEIKNILILGICLYMSPFMVRTRTPEQNRASVFWDGFDIQKKSEKIKKKSAVPFLESAEYRIVQAKHL